MEVVSFFVEMAVYTLMGIIVNAGTTLQYITGKLLLKSPSTYKTYFFFPTYDDDDEMKWTLIYTA